MRNIKLLLVWNQGIGRIRLPLSSSEWVPYLFQFPVAVDIPWLVAVSIQSSGSAYSNLSFSLCTSKSRSLHFKGYLWLCLGPICIIWDNLSISKSLIICKNYLLFFFLIWITIHHFQRHILGNIFFSPLSQSLFFLFLFDVWFSLPLLLSLLSSQSSSHWVCVCMCVSMCMCKPTFSTSLST